MLWWQLIKYEFRFSSNFLHKLTFEFAKSATKFVSKSLLYEKFITKSPRRKICEIKKYKIKKFTLYNKFDEEAMREFQFACFFIELSYNSIQFFNA